MTFSKRGQKTASANASSPQVTLHLRPHAPPRAAFSGFGVWACARSKRLSRPRSTFRVAVRCSQVSFCSWGLSTSLCPQVWSRWHWPCDLANCAKLRQTAAIGGAQVVGANLLSIVLVLVYPSALALILPRIFSAPIWLFAVRALHPWSPKAGTEGAPLQPFITYAWAVLGVEVVTVLRLEGDKIIVGPTLGPQALGLYFMGFNTGLSLSNAFATALSTVVFTHLSQSSDRAAAMRQSIIVSLGLIAPIVIL